MIQYPPAIVDAFTEVDASDSRAQRRTGANQLTTQGTAPSQGQLGRTSTGVQTANAALGMRMGYWMDQITDLVFKPFLEACHAMNSYWLPEDEISEFFDKERQEDQIRNPLDIKNAELKFEMLAGSKLKSRMAMIQLAPTLVQLLQLQPVLEAIGDQQLKVDWVEVIQSLLDSVSWPGTQKFIVEMTPQDMQMQQQKNQMAMQNSALMIKHQNAMQEIEQKARGQAGTHIIRGLVDHMDPEKQMNALGGLQAIIEGGQNGGNQQGAQNDQGQAGGPGQGGQGA
jgi:hypothetical protein